MAPAHSGVHIAPHPFNLRGGKGKRDAKDRGGEGGKGNEGGDVSGREGREGEWKGRGEKTEGEGKGAPSLLYVTNTTLVITGRYMAYA